MPIITDFFINGVFLSVLFYFNNFKLLETFTGSMNIFSLLISVYYTTASAISGGVTRAWAGITMVGLSIIDFAIQEPTNSILLTDLAIVGSLAPL